MAKSNIKCRSASKDEEEEVTVTQHKQVEKKKETKKTSNKVDVEALTRRILHKAGDNEGKKKREEG